jgi:hypothetical protein
VRTNFSAASRASSSSRIPCRFGAGRFMSADGLLLITRSGQGTGTPQHIVFGHVPVEAFTRRPRFAESHMGSHKASSQQTCIFIQHSRLTVENLGMAAVVYVDLDGTLHHDWVQRHPERGVYINQQAAPGRVLFEWAPQLEHALMPYPDARIVLSTSWVRVLGYSKTLKKIPVTLRSRVVGATYHSSFSRNTQERGPHDTWELQRGHEVLADVHRRKPDAWVAVDDTDEGWPEEARSHLVICDPTRGLGELAAQERLDTVLRLNFGTLA